MHDDFRGTVFIRNSMGGIINWPGKIKVHILLFGILCILGAYAERQK